MNKTRRQQLLIVIQKLKDAVQNLQNIKDEEDMIRENIPENLETSEVYENSERCSDTIEDAISDIEGAIENIIEIT